jgi:hypothetical protein
LVVLHYAPSIPLRQGGKRVDLHANFRDMPATPPSLHRRHFCSLPFAVEETLRTMRIKNRLTAIFGLTALAIAQGQTEPESGKPMMKAAIVRQYGGPEVLKIEEIARPEPKENEVLVRVIAASVNAIDAAIREGVWHDPASDPRLRCRWNCREKGIEDHQAESR